VYAVKLVGPDHVAIGIAVASPCLPHKRRSTSASLPQSQRFKSLWPLFTVGMVQRGYSDADIQKILGGNVLRVTLDVLA
jgi:membrane dipeptidase